MQRARNRKIFSFVWTILFVALVHCDGSYMVISERHRFLNASCPDQVLDYTIYQQHPSGIDRRYRGYVDTRRLEQEMVVLSTGATGAAPDTFHFIASCPGSGEVVYDTGPVNIDESSCNIEGVFGAFLVALPATRRDELCARCNANPDRCSEYLYRLDVIELDYVRSDDARWNRPG